MFRKFSPLFSFFLLFAVLTSCGIYKKEIVYISNPDTPEKKAIEITVENAPTGIIYYSPIQPIPEGKTHATHLFTAKGLGGLGAMLDSYANMLIPFEGLHVGVSSWVPANKIDVTLTANGDSSCQNLFHFNRDSSQIEINNPAQINTLTECALDVKIAATDDDNKATTYTDTFSFVFNLTFKDYSQKNDPLVLALLKQHEMTDVNQLVAWLSRFENSSKLALNNKEIFGQVQHVNALTGLSHVVLLDVSGTSLSFERAISYLNQLNELNLSNTKISSKELLRLSYQSNIQKLSLANMNLRDLSFLDNQFKNLKELDLSENQALFNHLSADDIQKFSTLKNLQVLNIANTGIKDFSQLNALANLQNSLVRLNLSKNDLSSLDNSDTKFLKNLSALESLDVSHTNMSVLFLNDYFQSLEIAANAKLKEFIYRGRYIKNAVQQDVCDVSKDSFILNILSLKLLSTLETIDFHGQGCVDSTGKEYGLTNTDIFKNVESLINLNISSTPVASFAGIEDLPNLSHVVISDPNGAISLGRTACQKSTIGIEDCSVLDEDTPIEITITDEPNGIVYYSALLPSSGNVLYTAKGLGGLGAVLDDSVNVLTPFDGLKVNVSARVPANKIQIELNASGDTICSNLFKFNSDVSRIQINNSHFIDTLVECSLNVKVKATDKDSQVVTYEQAFPFVFNLTLKEYEQRNDPLVKALMEKVGVNDVTRLISWLQMPYNSSTLKVEQKPFGAQIHHANALTGLVHLISLDVSGTSFDSTRALSYLTQLNELNLSNTIISSKELGFLSEKSHVTKLSLINMNLRDLSFLKGNFTGLQEIDLSNNSVLFNYLSANDIQNLSQLTNLRILNIAHTGLRNFVQLSTLNNFENTLVQLNLSQNDLSLLDNSDGKFLKNLFQLESLNVSYSNMNVPFLNDYFKSLEVSGHAKLKEFFYRARYKKSESIHLYCDPLLDAFGLNIASLTLVSSLENIDFHGQGCIDNKGKEFGLINTEIFRNSSQLVHLDISSTPVRDFSGLQNLSHLSRVIVVDNEGGISMSRTGCQDAVLNLIPNVDVYSCSLLSEPQKENRVFNYSSSTQTFTVPENVWNITIRGCSGANGGAGGGAGGALGYQVDGMYIVYKYNGADGGKSGYVNNNPSSFTAGGLTPFRGESLVQGARWYIYPAHSNQTGGPGGMGAQSEIKTNEQNVFQFAAASSSVGGSAEKCSGGVNGAGGASIQSFVKIGRSDPQPDKFMSGPGAMNQYVAWSSPIQTVENIRVIPGQIFKINVGGGGVGGKGGMPEPIHLPDGTILNGLGALQPIENKGYWGNPGLNGTNGTDGFVAIEWNSGS